MRLWSAVGILAVLAATGCHSTRPYDYEGRDSNATVVFYRLSDLNLGLVKAYIGVDDKYVVTLDNNAYTEIRLAPGRHPLTVAGDGFMRRDSLAVEVADLERLYFEVDPNPARWATTVAGVEPVSTVAIAVTDLTYTRPFLLVARTEQEFLDKLASLERREPATK